jgi:N-acetylglucosamine malate deacetylase 1
MNSILVLSAHPDDLEMSCGGTVAKLIGEGKTVTNIILNESVPHAEYLQKSRAILGFSSLSLDIADKPIRKAVEIIEEAINDLSIDTIITHWGEDWHQEHRQCSEIGRILARRQPINLWYMSSYPYNLKYKSFSPNMHIGISNKDYIKKEAAIKSYTNIGVNWRRGVSSHDSWRGSRIDTKFAEVFMVEDQVIL